jgi:hypothetical protein
MVHGADHGGSDDFSFQDDDTQTAGTEQPTEVGSFVAS